MADIQDNAKVYNADVKNSHQWTDRMEGNIRGKNKDSLNAQTSIKVDPTSIPAKERFQDL